MRRIFFSTLIAPALAAAQTPVPGLQTGVIAGVAATRASVAFDAGSPVARTGASVTAGFRACATCWLTRWPVDVAGSGVASITATSVAGITPHAHPYAFGHRLAGVQLIAGVRKFPWVKTYVLFPLNSQYGAERLGGQSSDTLFNYIDWAKTNSYGAEIGHVFGGAIDVRLTRVSSTFLRAEYRKDTTFTPHLPYRATLVNVGFTGPFTGFSGSARIRETSKNYYDRGFFLTDENDVFGGTTDSSYTQGIQLSWQVNRWPTSGKFGAAFNKVFPIVSGAAIVPGIGTTAPASGCDSVATPPCGLLRFSLGQTEYTPPSLIDTFPNLATRPFAGYAFISASATEVSDLFSVTTEVMIGRLGPGSGARETQSLAHWINAWTAPRPVGWKNQLRNRWQASLRNEYQAKLLQYCLSSCDGSKKELRVFDLNPNAEVLLGWPITRFSAGGTARLGLGFPDLQGYRRIPVTATSLTSKGREVLQTIAEHFWFNAFFNVASRYVERNQLLTGSSADVDDRGWRATRLIDREPFVTEYAGGVAFGIERVTFAFQRVSRSAEYKPGGGAHRFGSFTIGFGSSRAW